MFRFLMIFSFLFVLTAFTDRPPSTSSKSESSKNSAKKELVAFSDNQQTVLNQNQIETKSPASNVNECPLLPSARPCINKCEDNKWGYFSELSFLYMQPKVDNIPMALVDTNLGFFETKVIFPQSKFKPGFKLLIGSYIPRLTWDMTAGWAQLYSKTSKDLSSDEHKFLPVYYDETYAATISPRFRTVSATHDLYFNSVYIDMGKSLWLSSHLALRIHGGLEADFIKQKLKVKYDNGNAYYYSPEPFTITSDHLFHDYETFTNTSKGAGIRIGFDSKWQLFSSEFSLLAAPTVAFLLTSFDMRQQIENRRDYALTFLVPVADYKYYFTTKVKEHLWVLRPNAQILLGLNYGHCFKNYQLSFNAAYEARYFWEQNLNRPSHIQRNSYPTKGDFFLQGLNCSLRLEF